MHRARGNLPLAELSRFEEQLDDGSGVTLRAVTPGDEPFLGALYATTREDDLAPTGWDTAQKAAFCDWQFRLQQLDYAAKYPASGHRLILRDGVPIGRLWVAEREDHLLVVDLALLPEHRRGGIGTLLLREVFAEGDRAGLPVRLTVLRTNPRAAALCKRLGFGVREEAEALVELERPPAPLPDRA